MFNSSMEMTDSTVPMWLWNQLETCPVPPAFCQKQLGKNAAPPWWLALASLPSCCPRAITCLFPRPLYTNPRCQDQTCYTGCIAPTDRNSNFKAALTAETGSCPPEGGHPKIITPNLCHEFVALKQQFQPCLHVLAMHAIKEQQERKKIPEVRIYYLARTISDHWLSLVWTVTCVMSCAVSVTENLKGKLRVYFYCTARSHELTCVGNWDCAVEVLLLHGPFRVVWLGGDATETVTVHFDSCR